MAAHLSPTLPGQRCSGVLKMALISHSIPPRPPALALQLIWGFSTLPRGLAAGSESQTCHLPSGISCPFPGPLITHSVEQA